MDLLAALILALAVGTSEKAKSYQKVSAVLALFVFLAVIILPRLI